MTSHAPRDMGSPEEVERLYAYGHLYDDADDSMLDRLDALLDATRRTEVAPVLPLPTVSERTR